MILRTTATLSAWLIAGFVLVLGGLYLLLVTVNWTDQPASEDAQRLALATESRSPVADDVNALVFALGFSASPEVDVWAAGRARATWFRAVATDPGLLLSERDPLSSQYAPPSSSGREALPIARTFDRVCWAQRSSDRECLAVLSGRQGEVGEWIEREQWLLERYLDLIGLSQWREIGRDGPLTPWSVLGPVVAGQRLLFVQAWSLAVQDQHAAVRGLLERDGRFWRGVLAQTSDVTTRRLVVERIREHFRWGSMVLKQLPGASGTEGIPDIWRQPLSADELSMLLVVASEWDGANQIIAALARGDDPYAQPDTPAVRSPLDRLLAQLARPLVQPQDFANRYASELLQVTDALDVPVEAWPEAISQLREHRPAVHDLSLVASAYNFVGISLISMMEGVYEGLAQHASLAVDLEGIRRATLLANEMRAAGISDGRGAVLLAPAALNDPYTGAAFLWEEATGALIFEGLAEGGSRVHYIWY